MLFDVPAVRRNPRSVGLAPTVTQSDATLTQLRADRLWRRRQRQVRTNALARRETSRERRVNSAFARRSFSVGRDGAHHTDVSYTDDAVCSAHYALHTNSAAQKNKARTMAGPCQDGNVQAGSVGGEAVDLACAAGGNEVFRRAAAAEMSRIPRRVAAAGPVGVTQHGFVHRRV